MNYIIGGFYDINDQKKFLNGIMQAVDSVNSKSGIFIADNLFTIGRNLSFLNDKPLMDAHRQHAKTPVEMSIIWRIAIVAWAAHHGTRLGDGDFVECGCYKGVTARIVYDYLSFSQFKDRKYYLYDLFIHDEKFAHHSMPEHGKNLFERVKKLFIDYSNVKVIQGEIPSILNFDAPEKVAFLHIDLNNADAEIGAIEYFFDRMLDGAIILLDDYGWSHYREQKNKEDEWFRKRGYKVLELPTGQGLVIK